MSDPTLAARISQKLAEVGVPEETRTDITELISVYIANNATAEEIHKELTELAGDIVSLEFVRSLVLGGSQAPEPAPSLPAAPSVPSLYQSPFARSAPRNGPRHGGIQKRQFAPNNKHNTQRALNDMALRRKTRCPAFPHCAAKMCPFLHLTQPCYAYPNCKNPPGTCPYYHAGEDNALIAQQERTTAEQVQRHNETLARLLSQNGIDVCKRGASCTLPTCRFAHSTPAAPSTQVTVFEWCPAGKECTDASCARAHPLYGVKAAPAQEERSLEQCLFGKRCMNRFCKYRHASSPVLCRDGADCKRIDCFFTHPLSTECRYGLNCKNAYCRFKHPEGREEQMKKPMVWTAERKFAVNDGEVLEKAPAQEDASMTA